eukprot:gene1067-10586_t
MSFNVSAFLEKTRSKDKDLRHMALLDLHSELEKDTVRIDDSSQKKVADAVLLLIEDTSAEVQGAAVKCFEPLVKKLTQKQVEDWVNKLVANITGDEEEKRDISNMALKTLVSKIPAENALEPIKKALNILLDTCNPKVDEEIKMESLDVLSDILGRFGGVLSNKHKDLQKAFIGELAGGSSSLRKRVINCLSALSIHLNDELFKQLFQFVLSGIEKESEGENLGVYILLCSSISKAAGYRVGKYLKEVVPLLVKVADIVADKEEEEDDVRENIMLAFVSFIQMTPDEAKEFIDYYIILSKEYLEYDPNYSYDDSDDDEMEVEENEEEFDDDEEGGFSDDDDVSWKVRKGAAKCLLTLIQTYPEYISSAYLELCSEEDHTLVSRFKEREEGVKIDVFQVFSALLKQTVVWGPSNQVIKQKDQIKTLQQMTDVIMIRLKKQLKERSSKVRQGVFEVLKDLVIALQGGLEEHIKSLVPFICSALNDKRANSSLKLEVLLFLENLLTLHKPEVFGDSYEKLSQSVFVCVQDRFYKVISEALKVCGGLVKVVSTFNGTDKYSKSSSELFKQIYDRLCLQDIDKDVKESAIESMGELISKIGKGIEKEVNDALKVLLERLKNEITRLTTCRTFSLIAISEQANLSSILKDLIEELSSLLKKNNRTLRQASLISLSNFVTHYGKSIDSKQYNSILEEVKSLLNHIKDTDLALTQLAFDLVINILNENSKMSSTVQKLILPSGLTLLESSTLQGGTLNSFALFLQVMVPTCGFLNLLSSVLDSVKSVKPPVPKQIYVNIGKCVSSLLNNSTEQEFKKTVEKFVKEIKSQDDNIKLLALFSLGEIGSHKDISSYNIKNDIEACFDSGSEEVKNAASTSLGNISVGNLSNYLPSILESISKQPKRKYLLLHSLKEIISHNSKDLSLFIKDIMPLLFEDCDNSEEGIRNVVSECLGKLAVVEYTTVISELKSKLDSKSEDVKSTIISAMKYTISDKDKSYDKQLTKDIFKFLKYLDKKQHHKVRRASVLLLTSALHSKPTLVINNLGGILTKLYEDSIIDKSLLRKVDVGPFKIDVDDGIDLRKSVYECMETLLENCVDRIDTIKFATQFSHGFADENSDIKMLSHLMLQKLCDISPSAVLHVVDDLCDPLKSTMTTKLKENAVQTDKDRHAELIRSSIKATFSLSRVKGIEDSIKFTDLLNKTVKANSNLENLYESIQDKHKE